MMRREYQVLPDPILPLTTLDNCCVIIYFAKHPPGKHDLGSLLILCAPVDYAQPGYAAAVYGTTTFALVTNRCRDYRTASFFGNHPCTCLRFYINSNGSREMGNWNRMLLTCTTVPPILKEVINTELSLRYVDGIFAVRPHVSERDPIS